MVLRRPPMRYIPRSEQSAYQVGYSMLTYVPSHRDGLSDEYFDGVPVASKSPALHWIEENEVHRAPWLSSTIDSSSYFLGPQSMLCRDELRDVTHVAVPDDGLIMKTVSNGQLVEAKRLSSKKLKRAHIELHKFSGRPYVLHASDQMGKSLLFFNGELVPTRSTDVDFPFMCFDQSRIGHVPSEGTFIGLISYKDRSSGTLFIRSISDEDAGEEIEIQTPPTVGGADIALVNGGGFVRINSVNEGRLVPLIAEISTEPSAEIEFQAVDLGNDNIDTFLPPNAAVFADHLGIIHVPIPSLVDGQYVLLDHVPNHFTRGGFRAS
jgi:hypothetical protein